MSENNRRVSIALSWGAIAAGATALIAWGGNQVKISTLDARTEQLAADQRDAERQINTHDKQIAVLESKLDTILSAVKQINDKLERQERRRQ